MFANVFSAPPLSKHSSSFENPRSSYSRNATRREESLKAAAAAASAQDQVSTGIV